MSGQLIGQRYRVLRKIGEGGMAVVHIAVDEKLGRDVAIKILRERFENHDEIRTRFQHEAKAISAFDHPNILKVYDFSGEGSRQLWIVTELIHGRNLAQILETTPSGWLHPIIAASIVREICRALATAHEHGVVHRDVKPENVMITHHGTVKLMDFGIAKIQRITSMTQTGMFMGSPSYMSPEQVRGRDVDNRSDIYSLGVLFYELITGKLPFTGSSTADVAMRILNGDFAHPRFIMAGVPDSIDQCIIQCMSLQPENRPQSVESVGESIDALLKSFGLESSLQELERCFKDPKAYGDRLARILKVSETKQEPTVLIENKNNNQVAIWNSNSLKSPIPRPDISGEHLPIGSQRRDHLLPPRTVPHLTKKHMSAENIAAHLPERRHQQRATASTHFAQSNITTELAKNAVKNTEGRPYFHAPAAQPAKTLQYPTALPAKNNGPYPAPYKNKARDMRPVSRIVPATPRRPQRQIRYIVHENYSSNNGSDNISKLVIALLLMASATLIWVGNLRNAELKQRQGSVAAKRLEKSQTNANPGVAAKQRQQDIVPVATTPVAHENEISAKNVESPKEPLPKYATKKTESQTTKSQNKQSTDLAKEISSSAKKQKTTQKPTLNYQQQETKAKATVQNQLAETKDAPVAVEIKKQPISEQIKQKDKPANIDVISKNKENDGNEVDSAPIHQTTTSPTKKPNDSLKQTTSATIAISSTPAAELYIDGRRHGTTNNSGSSSDWLEINTGRHTIELRRTGFMTKKESIFISNEPRQKFGPYVLQRGETANPIPNNYKLTLSTNLPPVEVTIINIETNATQTIVMTQPSKTINLDKGVYEVSMSRKGDTRKRRLDLSGATQQLTFSVDFRDTPEKN